jgi:hypothetical protein
MHFGPNLVIFQNARGVRKFGSPHFLHEYTTIEEVFRCTLSMTLILAVALGIFEEI